MSNPNPKNQWEKGCPSPNPRGRPRKIFDAKAELSTQMLQVDESDEHRRTNGQILIAKLIASAKHGSVRATNEILDRLLGKPAQAVAIADLRDDNRDEAIASILESARELRELKKLEATSGDGKQTIQ
jgi:hypothetical protein